MEFHQDLWPQQPASEPRLRPVMKRHCVGLSQSGSESFGMPTGIHSPGGGHLCCWWCHRRGRSFPVLQRKEWGFTLTGGRARQAQRVLESFPRATVSQWVTYIPRKRWRWQEVLLTRLAQQEPSQPESWYSGHPQTCDERPCYCSLTSLLL